MPVTISGRALDQTRDGYIWLTTWDGVARFDGVRFEIYNKFNIPAHTANRFAYRASWEGEHGNLWIGTDEGAQLCQSIVRVIVVDAVRDEDAVSVPTMVTV